MDCRYYRKLFKSFIEDELPEEEKEKLLYHIDSCEYCKNEMKLRFLVITGMDRLSRGGSLNLRDDFDNKIEATRKQCLYVNKRNLFYKVLFEICFILSFAILIRGFLMM